MEENKITLIDTFGENSFHEIFNAAFLLSVLNIYQTVIYLVRKVVSKIKKSFSLRSREQKFTMNM